MRVCDRFVPEARIPLLESEEPLAVRCEPVEGVPRLDSAETVLAAHGVRESVDSKKHGSTTGAPSCSQQRRSTWAAIASASSVPKTRRSTGREVQLARRSATSCASSTARL